MKGYKGFNAKLQCTPSGKVFQYEIGTTYTEPTANLCNNGFHFCESPLDIFNYYKPNDGSRYTEVEANGVTDQEKEDSKRACTSLTIGAEIKITALIKAAIRFVFDRVTSTTGNSAHSATTGNSAHSATTGYSAHSATTGDSAHSATTGYSAHSATTGSFAHSATTGKSAHSATTGNYAHSATTGNYAHSATTGDSAESSVSGKNAIAASLGVKGKAKGGKGDWLVLAEYCDDGSIKAIGVAHIGGKKIKPDTFYTLKDGKFTEAGQ